MDELDFQFSDSSPAEMFTEEEAFGAPSSIPDSLIFDILSVDSLQTISTEDEPTRFGEMTEESSSAILDSWMEDVAIGCETGSSSSNVSVVSPVSDSDAAPVCSVCLREVGELHNHYGGKCCSSCRAFFRRAVQNDNHKVFSCPEDGRCVIDSRSRRSCSWCRFQKCLSAGMNPSWTMSEEERLRRREKRIKVALQSKSQAERRQQEKQLSEARNVVSVPRGPALNWTEEENGNILRIRAYCLAYMANFYSTMPDRDFELACNFFNMLLTGQKNKPANFRRLEVRQRELFNGLVLGLEDMVTLSEGDRYELVTNNFPMFFMQFLAIHLHEKDFLSHLNRVKTAMAARMEDSAFLRLMFGMLSSVEQRGQPLRLEYDQMYASPWAPSADIEDRHRQLMFKIQRWPRFEEHEPVDPILAMLGVLVLIFSPLALTLRSRKAVEELQQRYALMLYRYLKTTYKERAAAKFADGMIISALASEAYEMHSKMLPV